MDDINKNNYYIDSENILQTSVYFLPDTGLTT